MTHCATRLRCSATNTLRRKGAPCRRLTLLLQTITRWQQEKRITEAEASLLRTTKPLCPAHAIQFLEDLHPGAARRIYGDAMRGWQRNWRPGEAILARMHRAGLRYCPNIPPPSARRRCKAKARSGAQCKQYAVKGEVLCPVHGGCAVRMRRLKPGDPRRAVLVRLSEQRQAKRAARWEAKKRAHAAGLLAPHIGFRAARPQPRSLRDEFLEHHNRRPRSGWTPDYER
jgi:hypothetical protein